MSNQSVGEEERQISNNMLSMKTIFEYMNTNVTNGALIIFDQDKEFDKICIHFILATPKKKGFGTDSTSWIQTFYKNIQSKIQTNGAQTEPFDINRSVRQGWCYYITVIEAHKNSKMTMIFKE
jgi:hypothetical protein